MTDANDDTFLFSPESIVQSPLPGYTVPSSITFSPDDKFISYLYSPDASFHREVFIYDLRKKTHERLFRPPGGEGIDESNFSAEEKLRRERARERGLGVTRYEWVTKTASFDDQSHQIMVPLPSGVCPLLFIPFFCCQRYVILSLPCKI